MKPPAAAAAASSVAPAPAAPPRCDGAQHVVHPANIVNTAAAVDRGGEPEMPDAAARGNLHREPEPGRYCSPRHRMPCNSRNEGSGSKCVSMTWQALCARSACRERQAQQCEQRQPQLRAKQMLLVPLIDRMRTERKTAVLWE